MTGNDYCIRQFESGDGPAVRELHELAMRDAGDFVEGVPEPDLADVEGRYVEPDDCEFLVAERDGAVVGMVATHPAAAWILADRFTFDVPTAELTRMRVHPDHQRAGIGRRMVTELESWAADGGVEQFVLDVSEDNTGARRFYETIGFEYLRTVSFEALGRTFRLATYRKPIAASTDSGK